MGKVTAKRQWLERRRRGVLVLRPVYVKKAQIKKSLGKKREEKDKETGDVKGL